MTWLNFFAGSYVRLDVRLPGKRNFRKAAAYVYFQFLFDRELEKFVYQCRFENQNLVHDGLDETVSELAAQKGESTFPGAYHVKSDTAVVFRRLITDTLFDELGGSVDDAIELVEEAVDVLFPNSHYAVPAEEDDELAEVDDDE